MYIRSALILIVMTLVFSGAGTTGEKLTIKVSPAVAFAPATLIVRATVEADAENRAVTISAESADFYRSSKIALEGEYAPRTETFEFRGLPSGTYEVRATLFDASGHERGTARQQVEVMLGGSQER